MLQRLHKGFKGICEKNASFCEESSRVTRDQKSTHNYETICKN